MMRMTVLLTLLLFSQTAQSAFVLNSTRYIYTEANNSIPIEVSNRSDRKYGGQVTVYLDGTDPDKVTTETPVVLPSPPVFKSGPKSKQRINLRMINKEALPRDRESLFWLNVLEIPMSDRASGASGNSIALAMNIKVKLLYRPDSISEKRQGAESKIVYRASDSKLTLVNKSPFYFAISQLEIGGKSVYPKDEITRSKLQKFPPNSAVDIGPIQVEKGQDIIITSIDDWGAAKKYTLIKESGGNN